MAGSGNSPGNPGMGRFLSISRRSIPYENIFKPRSSIIVHARSRRNTWKFCVNIRWITMKGICGHSAAAPPLQGLRVKLRGSAESAEQQSPGWKSTRSGLWNPGLGKDLGQALSGRCRLRRPFRACILFMLNPGLWRAARPPPRALLRRAFSASLSLTRMPERGRLPASPLQGLT